MFSRGFLGCLLHHHSQSNNQACIFTDILANLNPASKAN